jgi:hypothetical protein
MFFACENAMDDWFIPPLFSPYPGFHAIDLETGSVQDLYVPSLSKTTIHPHAIITLPRSSGTELLLCYDSAFTSSAWGLHDRSDMSVTCGRADLKYQVMSVTCGRADLKYQVMSVTCGRADLKYQVISVTCGKVVRLAIELAD